MDSEEISEMEGTSAPAEDIPLVEPAKPPINNKRTRSMNHIFRAPTHIKYDRASDFEPKLVSIGPHYHGRESLKPMEKLKLRCMSDLMNMRPSGNKIGCVPVDQFIDFEWDTYPFYKEQFDLKVEDLVEMLILDSCFIIRIILSFNQIVMTFLDVNMKEVRSDLLLLENQIPLLFIVKVYYWLFMDPRVDRPTLPTIDDALEEFICWGMPWRTNYHGMSFWSPEDLIPKSTYYLPAVHLLHLYWGYSCTSSVGYSERYLIPVQEQPSSAEINLPMNEPKVIIKNATELHQMAGITFEKLDREGLYVTFSNGIMKMPCLNIDSNQKTLLVNLIAFESSSIEQNMRSFTTYIKILDELIDSERDVELLQQSGVIYNTLSSHKMAATFFNEIGNFCICKVPAKKKKKKSVAMISKPFLIFNKYNPDLDHFSNLYEDVKKYYNSRWNRRWTSLTHRHFSSPWAGISVFAGVTLLILSALQTFYTICGYYKPRQ
ncbi:hypothetical protein FCM35_KLT10571 [Carex littledalei]|uniref:Uncharacterized protein n=1 Tax=Carex littledalei TaxID=544730 RepID=A0A833VGQ2_9POAL|nr:hypothetical protein FCM35_KLT10571 [Carex littledalei]